MAFQYRSDRLNAFAPFLYVEIDRAKKKAASEGKKLIDLSIGDPDLPSCQPVVEAAKYAVTLPQNHRYPAYRGIPKLRETFCRWFKKRFGVQIDPDKELLALIGSKEGLAHLSFALMNPGDTVLVPNPAYPVYSRSVLLAGGKPVDMPLTFDNHYLPDLAALDKEARKAKLLFLNYPNNPTGASATLRFFEEAIAFAKNHHMVICQDAAYSEIYLGVVESPSILAVPGAMECAVEFHSLSKSLNMTGWRVGFAVGNREIIESLAKVKEFIDSGIPAFIQDAAVQALECEDHPEKMRRVYRKRRSLLVPALKESGLAVFGAESTFYVWVKVPAGYTSASFTKLFIEELGIVAIPGSGFGSFGEGYIRFSLTTADSAIEEAAMRIRKQFANPS